MRLLLAFTLLLSCAFTLPAQEHKVAVTIDDLPCVHCGSGEDVTHINQKILEALRQYAVPAVGFVNEGKLFPQGQPDSARWKALSLWTAQGQELGNHTYSHVDFNTVSVAQYEADLLKGEKATRPLMDQAGKSLQWFRPPYLRTGTSKERLDSLHRMLSLHGYLMAPVTIDNDEYLFAVCYQRAREQKDSMAMRIIGMEYLAYMRGIFAHYEGVSRSLLGRNMSHVLLLHANALNADYLPYLLAMIQQRGYGFVSLADALKDEAYGRTPAPARRGYSWLLRWQLAQGDSLHLHPDISPQVEAWRQAYQSHPAERPAIQVLDGPTQDVQAILAAMRRFSGYFLARDAAGLASCYASEGKAFPDKSGIISGQEALLKFWDPGTGSTPLHHRLTPLELRVMGDTAIDYGYFEGATQSASGQVGHWAGKYVVVWRREAGQWRMQLDIWNRL